MDGNRINGAQGVLDALTAQVRAKRVNRNRFGLPSSPVDARLVDIPVSIVQNGFIGVDAFGEAA